MSRSNSPWHILPYLLVILSSVLFNNCFVCTYIKYIHYFPPLLLIFPYVCLLTSIVSLFWCSLLFTCLFIHTHFYCRLIFHRIQVRPLPCLVTPSLSKCSCWILFNLDLSKLLHKFTICCYMDLSKSINRFLWFCMFCQKLLHGFAKVVVRGFANVALCISLPLTNKTKLKFVQDFKACWSFCFELKVLNDSKYSMTWVRCTFSNVLTWEGSFWWTGICSELQ